MFSHEHEVEMTRRYRRDHDLMGREADELLSIFDVLTEGDIWQYRYPEDDELNAVGVRGIYLGNYVRWDPKAQHELMIEKHGYQGARFERTFDTYDHVDCWNFMGIHDHLKLVKHGYSKVTDHACREIRHGRLTREHGLALVARYSQVEPPDVDLFCEWLGVDQRALQFIVDCHRNKQFWAETEPGRWAARNSVMGEGAKQDGGDSTFGFIATSKIDNDGSRRYVTIGKGYPV